MIKVGDKVSWVVDFWEDGYGWKWKTYTGDVLSIKKEYVPGGIGVWGYILECRDDETGKIYFDHQPTLKRI